MRLYPCDTRDGTILSIGRQGERPVERAEGPIRATAVTATAGRAPAALPATFHPTPAVKWHAHVILHIRECRPMPHFTRALGVVILFVVSATRLNAQCTGEAQRAFRARELDQARAAAQTQLRESPRDAAANYCMGRVAEAQSRSGEAVDHASGSARATSRCSPSGPDRPRRPPDR